MLTPIVLLGGLWFIWRSRFVGPTQFDPDLPSIFYDRLQRWALRLGLHSPDSHTPYERARTLGSEMPEGRSSIESITSAYVRYRFSPRRGVEEATPGERTAGSSLFASWQELRPILWKTWFNKLFGIRQSRKGGSLHAGQEVKASNTCAVPAWKGRTVQKCARVENSAPGALFDLRQLLGGHKQRYLSLLGQGAFCHLEHSQRFRCAYA